MESLVKVVDYLGCNSAYRLRYWNANSSSLGLPVSLSVATVLTACGIETEREKELLTYPVLVATVLTACGIETLTYFLGVPPVFLVATVLTACGIETRNILSYRRKFLRLQQCLPLAVLKPFCSTGAKAFHLTSVATVLTACGIETDDKEHHSS